MKLHNPDIIYPPFYQQDCELEIRDAFFSCVELARRCGAEVSEIEIPELHDIAIAHRMIILAEMGHNTDRCGDGEFVSSAFLL